MHARPRELLLLRKQSCTRGECWDCRAGAKEGEVRDEKASDHQMRQKHHVKFNIGTAKSEKMHGSSRLVFLMAARASLLQARRSASQHAVPSTPRGARAHQRHPVSLLVLGLHLEPAQEREARHSSSELMGA
eukprot:6209223-Pleurochrysis_carterae.AAC.9